MFNDIQKAYIFKLSKISECAAQVVLLLDLYNRKLITKDITKDELTKIRNTLLPIVGEGEETQQIDLFIITI